MSMQNVRLVGLLSCDRLRFVGELLAPRPRVGEDDKAVSEDEEVVDYVPITYVRFAACFSDDMVEGMQDLPVAVVVVVRHHRRPRVKSHHIHTTGVRVVARPAVNNAPVAQSAIAI